MTGAADQPFTIWLMRRFFVEVPVELNEAAMIDGCNRWQAFYLIMLPAVLFTIAVQRNLIRGLTFAAVKE